jgi:hypothetical protein
MSTIDRKKEDCRVFASYGSLLGLGIPTSILLIYHLFINNLSSQKDVLTGVFFALGFVTLLPYYFHTKYDTHPKLEKLIDYSLYGTGIATIVLTTIAVYFTGGMENSLLSFYFFFVPSAIAISFEAKISLKIICTFGCLAVIYLFLKAPNNPIIANDNLYKVFYCIIIILQFLSIYLLELKSKSRRYETK